MTGTSEHKVEHSIGTSQVEDTRHVVESTAASAAAAYELVKPGEKEPPVGLVDAYLLEDGVSGILLENGVDLLVLE